LKKANAIITKIANIAMINAMFTFRLSDILEMPFDWDVEPDLL